MSIEARLDRAEALVQKLLNGDATNVQIEYCNWSPFETPPEVPNGVVLTPQTEMIRNALMAMDNSIPDYPD